MPHEPLLICHGSPHSNGVTLVGLESPWAGVFVYSLPVSLVGYSEPLVGWYPFAHLQGGLLEDVGVVLAQGYGLE